MEKEENQHTNTNNQHQDMDKESAEPDQNLKVETALFSCNTFFAKNLKIEGKIENTKDLIKIHASFMIKLSDFEIERPSLLLQKVKNEIVIEINLNFYPT